MPDDEPTTAGGGSARIPPDPEPTAQERARRRDRPLVQRAIVADALIDAEERERIGFDPSPDAPIPVVIELNLRHRDGLEGARRQFLDHFADTLPGEPAPERVADTYHRCQLSVAAILRLVEADQRQPDPARRAIYRVWPDFPIHPLIDASCATVKADAARRSYDASGRGVTWAVLDSGIDQHHRHFSHYENLKGHVADLHRGFTRPGDPELGDALVDRFGHGTHVAGIIAGGLPARLPRGSDPGNAALAITVGATHRDMPHAYGVSYFSSKGPTGDGRLKPDLVAPGERITSCAAGKALSSAFPDGKMPAPGRTAVYVEDSGTSMAAPHVAGVIASFLSIRREFIGRPDEIKRIFLESATSLGRERYFQGHGLVDLMRAIQSV